MSEQPESIAELIEWVEAVAHTNDQDVAIVFSREDGWVVQFGSSYYSAFEVDVHDRSPIPDKILSAMRTAP